MGCRKLTYRETLSPLKVVYNDLIINENCYVGGYRYGFNGMERDDNVKGAGNSYTTEFRQYDPRVGRWLTLDPLMGMFAYMSPYVAYANNPIYYTDPYGLAPGTGGEDDKKGNGDHVRQLPSDPIQNLPEQTVHGGQEPQTPEQIVKRKVNLITGRTNPEGADGYRRSERAYKDAQELMRNKNSGYNSYDFARDYDKYGWGVNYDPQTVTDGSNGKKWQRESHNVIMEGKEASWERFQYFAGTLALAGGAYVAAPVLLSGSSVWGIQVLSWETVAIKMGISATVQGLINEGRINVIGVLGDGFLGYGSSAIIGSGLELNINVFKSEASFNYLGNGINQQQFLFNSSIGLAFGTGSSSLNTLMRSGTDGVKSSFLRELILGPRQFGNYGVSKYYEKRSR